MDDFGRYSKGGLKADLSNITQTGIQKISSIVENGGGGTVTSVNNIQPVNGNISLTADNIPEGTTNKYLTQTSYNTLTKNILTANGDILIRKNGEPDRLPIGTDTKLLSVSGSDLTWTNPKLNQLANLAPMMRENFTIDPNSTSNMLNWMMTQSNIFDNMILPNQDVNPFFWGTRGDTDYGEWKIQNTSANTLQIDTVNIVPAGIFIVFQFIRSLIANIMDDNLNDGTVRIRVNGINSGQTGGTVQILNTTVSDLGKFRTLTQGTGITLSQNDDTITISATASAVSLDDLSDVVITTPVNNNVLRYNGANWINGVLFTDNVTELNSLYFTTARVDSQVQSYFGSKSSVLCGTGINTFSTVTPPDVNNKVLVSDSTTTTGLVWNKLSIGGSYFSDLTITTPVNGNALVFNGNAWVNSTQVSTNTNNIVSISGRVDNLEANSVTITLNPAVTPYTYTYNQTTYPIIKTTYNANTNIIPQNALLQQVLNDANYENCGGSYNINGGGNLAVASLTRLATQLLLNGPTFATATLDGTNWTQQGASVGRINLNYVNNNLTPNAYTLYCASGAFLAGSNMSWWGLKNQALVAAQMLVTNIAPTAGADWDLLGNWPGGFYNGGQGVKININTNTTYFLIAITNPGSARISAAGIATSQTVNANYTFPTDVTLSNSTGALVVTKTSGLQNNEQWKINATALENYYVQTIVQPVIRNSNLVQLTNTQITDSSLKINNATNNFTILNSAGTNSYLNVDVPNDRLALPRNPWSHIYLPNNIAIFRVIAAVNVFAKLNIGNIADGIATNNPTVGALTWDDVNNQFNWNVSGSFRVTFDITVQGLDPQGQCDIMLRNPQDNSLYQGTRRSFNFFNGQYENISISFVCSVNNTNKIGVYWWLPPAAVAPSSFNIICWSIVASNLLTQ